MMTLHIQIGGLRCYTQRLQIILRSKIFLLRFGELTLQIVDLRMYLTLYVRYGALWILHAESAWIGNAIEIGYRELRVIAIAIHHNRPNEEWEQNLTECLEVAPKVEDTMIIERY